MAKLKDYCSICDIGTPIDGVLLGLEDSNEALVTYSCGHVVVKTRETTKPVTFNPAAVDGSGKSLWPFQIQGVEKAIETDYNLLIADQMALGKTSQALKAIASNYEELTPCLIVVRSATIWQWVQQYKVWCDTLPLGVFLIQGTKSFIPPGFRSYVISMDSIGRNGMMDKLKELGIKSVIVDEVHSFKDSSSKRSQALVGFIQEQGIKHKIFLSGTPIKNRADEYFVPLNLLHPELFPSLAHFRHKWLEQDDKNKWGRVKEWRQDEFRRLIEPFVIRRERNEVLKDLPAFKRTYSIIEIEDEAIRGLYNKELEKLREKTDAKANVSYADVQDNLMTLRRICGLAKVEWACEYVDEFLEETDDEKIALGIHHLGVRDSFKFRFENRGYGSKVLYLGGSDSPENKNRLVKRFAESDHRVMVIGMLAGGTGLDGLQVCNNTVVVERQWSSADEEQFEDRFNRPGQQRPVTAEYIIAKNTIDAYFYELVEEKRRIFGETISNQWSITEDTKSLNDMIEWTVGHRI